MPTHDRTWQADADEVSAEYVARCPACGDPIDYCQGHGDIGDPDGRVILDAHDNGDHRWCHPAGCAYPKVAEVTREHAMRYLADKVKDKIDQVPVRRSGPPWRRQNYVRRVDAYDAVDRALRSAIEVMG